MGNMEIPTPLREPAVRESDRRFQDLQSESAAKPFEPPDRSRDDEIFAVATDFKPPGKIQRNLPQAAQESGEDLVSSIRELERRSQERSDLADSVKQLRDLEMRSQALQGSLRDSDLSGPGFGGPSVVDARASKDDQELLDSVLMAKEPLSRAQLRRASAAARVGGPPGEEKQGLPLPSPGDQGSPIPPWPEVTSQPEFKALAQRRASELAAQRSMRRASEGSILSRAGPGAMLDSDFSF